MKDQDKTKEELINELVGMRQRIAKLEGSLVTLKQHQEATSVPGVITDITDRKAVEAALRESEERLQLALSGADIGLWDWDFRTGKATRDERTAAIYGYPSAEMDPGFEMWESVIHPADKPEVLDRFNKHLEGSTPFYEAEYRLITRSGETKWVLARGKVSDRDRDGKPLRVAGTLLDITDRWQAVEALRKAHDELEHRVEERTADLKTLNEDLLREIAERKATAEGLRESEAQKQAILDGITTNIAYVNEGLEIKWVNKTAADSVAKLPSQMLGHKCHEFWADPAKPCDGCPTVKAFKTKRSEHATMVTPDGRVWDENGEPVFDADGKLIGVVDIALNITEHKKVEKALRERTEELQTIMDSVPALIFYKDLENRIIRANRTWLQTFKPELCGGLAILTLLAPLRGRRVAPLTPETSPWGVPRDRTLAKPS